MGGDPLVYFTAKKLETLQQYDYLKLNERISLNSLVVIMTNIKQLSENIKGMFEEFLKHCFLLKALLNFGTQSPASDFIVY